MTYLIFSKLLLYVRTSRVIKASSSLSSSIISISGISPLKNLDTNNNALSCESHKAC